MTVEIKVGDCRDVLKGMADQSVQCCVTSPPYFGLRDYGVDGQMGLEASPDEFVAGMVEVFRQVHRVLRDDGTLWLNLGDSYSRSQSTNVPQTKNKPVAYPTHLKDGSSDGAVGRADRPGSRTGGLGEKQLLGIPWRVAFALQADGWYLRQDIIWHKPNPMPESVTDRCTKAHEYVFLLSKSPRYFYDAEAIMEEAVGQTEHDLTGPGYAAPGQSQNKGNRKRGTPPRHAQYESSDQSGLDGVGRGEGRNKRSVWTVATQPFKEAHFATFPPALIEPCIKAGSRPGDMVLDPFGGAGTTGLVADRLGRNAVLIELNPEYAEIARRRLSHDAGMFAEVV